MKNSIAILEVNRKTFYSFLENYSVEQLNKIPEGFSNNIIWNIGHIIVVQQMLVYNLSGLPMMVSEEMVNKYRKGTAPQGDVSQEEINEIKALLFTTLEQTKKDFLNDIFKNFNEFTTMTGFNVDSAKTALEFNNFHEGVHLGIILSLKKFI